MPWYIEFLIGIFLGVYVTSPKVRHVVNFIFIKFLKATDRQYKESEEESPDISDKGDVSPEELKRWLNKNPNIKIVKR